MLLAVKCIVDWSHIQTHKWAACITKARGQRVVRTRRENKTGQNKNQQHSREKEKYTENVPPNWIPALHDLWLHFVCCCHGFACAECWCFRFFFFAFLWSRWADDDMRCQQHANTPENTSHLLQSQMASQSASSATSVVFWAKTVNMYRMLHIVSRFAMKCVSPH